jgi:hypothetical protein
MIYLLCFNDVTSGQSSKSQSCGTFRCSIAVFIDGPIFCFLGYVRAYLAGFEKSRVVFLNRRDCLKSTYVLHAYDRHVSVQKIMRLCVVKPK